MPRPTRIQYEHAYYHVMNRGRGRQTIFHGDEYFHAFLRALEEAYLRFDARIHAYCLMGNHYHLLIETPRANLDRIMRHINGVYTQRFNRLKHTDGPLFRGRYKAIVVDEDAYLLQLSRYIHRNPAEVKSAARDVLDRYPWSSYLAYIGQAKAPLWLQQEQTYRMLGQRQRYAGYRAYVESGNDEALLGFYSKGNLATILGDRDFREAIANERGELQVSGSLPQALSERPSAAAIVKAVAQVFNVKELEITRRQEGRQSANLPRKLAMYYCQQLGDLPLSEIADCFGLKQPGSVSPALADIGHRLAAGEMKKETKAVERILVSIK